MPVANQLKTERVMDYGTVTVSIEVGIFGRGLRCLSLVPRCIALRLTKAPERADEVPEVRGVDATGGMLMLSTRVKVSFTRGLGRRYLVLRDIAGRLTKDPDGVGGVTGVDWGEGFRETAMSSTTVDNPYVRGPHCPSSTAEDTSGFSTKVSEEVDEGAGVRCRQSLCMTVCRFFISCESAQIRESI